MQRLQLRLHKKCHNHLYSMRSALRESPGPARTGYVLHLELRRGKSLCQLLQNGIFSFRRCLWCRGRRRVTRKRRQAGEIASGGTQRMGECRQHGLLYWETCSSGQRASACSRHSGRRAPPFVCSHVCHALFKTSCPLNQRPSGFPAFAPSPQSPMSSHLAP